MSSELDPDVGTGMKAEKPSYLSDHRERPRHKGGLWVERQRQGLRYGSGGREEQQTLFPALQELTVWSSQTRDDNKPPP